MDHFNRREKSLSMEIWIVSIILAIILYLLISEKIPIDLIAIGLIVILMLTNLLTPIEAVAGFANPAVLTVGAMFLISQGMIRTGAVGFLGERVIRYSKGKAGLALLIILTIVAAASAFLNNTPVVVLFIPVVMSMCCKFGLSPSKFLIPLSYASILAGSCTLIGTSTNIIVSDLSAGYGYGALEMFELSKVGVPIAVLGLGFLLLAAFKIMPTTANPTCELENGHRQQYLAEIHIPKGSILIEKNPSDAFQSKYPDVEVLELIRNSHIFYPGRDMVTILADDLLLVKGSANSIVEILQSKIAALPSSEKGLDFGNGEKHPVLVEMIVPPQSDLLEQRLKETDLNRDPDVHAIAIKRSNLHYTAQKLHDISLRVGDILLLWCPPSKLEELRSKRDVIIVEDIHHTIVHRRKVRIAVTIFAGLIFAAATGLADIMVCALTAVFLMAISGCLQLRDAYRSLQPNVLLLIAATIALGQAMQKTGASQVYAQAFLSIFANGSPVLVLAGILVLTSISTHLLSNNATAVLLLPMAISTAAKLGVDPKPFIIAVCLGASACFATPIGYQTNLLVYGPGGYRFEDYFRLGIPLNFLVIILGTFLIPIFWPF
jgi:di/tricarboxylate transporter